jgi:cytochrome c-type biogenesis protein CcmH/NrfG
LDPTNYSARYWLGQSYLAQAATNPTFFADAEYAFTVAIQLEPQNQDPYLALAQTYTQWGKTDLATYYYWRASLLTA